MKTERHSTEIKSDESDAEHIGIFALIVNIKL